MNTKNKTPILVDIIIISYARNEKLLQETITGIDSLINSEDSKELKFNIIVVESNKDISYDDINTLGHDIKTIYTEKEFGYHTYLNEGLKYCSAEWSCLCNNDLVFKPKWASNIIELILKLRTHNSSDWKYVSASPLNPREKWHSHRLGKIELGYGVRQHITGWCLFQSRNIFEKLGELEERIKFWFCDNWYSVALQHNKIPHLLVGTSIVEHHNDTEGTTTKDVDLSQSEKHKMTYGAGENYREIIREMLHDDGWGRTSDEEKKLFEKKTGRKYY